LLGVETVNRMLGRDGHLAQDVKPRDGAGARFDGNAATAPG
jgi:hypothetical protein